MEQLKSDNIWGWWASTVSHIEKPLNTLANQFSEWTMSPATPSSVSEPLQMLSVHKPNNTILTLAW